MANQTIGINVKDKNPYTMTVTNSGTLIGSDIELVMNLSLATPLTKEDILIALDQFKLFYEQSLGPGAETMGAAPP